MSPFGPIRVLVVEDEPIIAMCLEDILDALGCIAIGPAGRLSEGLALAENEALDAAIIDINLAGERSTPIAEMLRGRGVPFAFASGYGAAPEGFIDEAPLVEKPYGERDIEALLRVLIG
ncbi:response regulator [Sphingomonas sp. dw_22]|uniref:response regulator n=1 Tax=Sphingomonas sp. dw_22 TaxID=2721175 RepID=UPI001BD54A7A|nr:response regulator [Sphingomonas sp. dw_22]